MATAAKESKVTVHYIGTLEDGAVFDSSHDREPLTFVLGAGEVISGFDDAIMGMEEGENRKVTLSPEEAYGLRLEELVIEADMSDLPDGVDVGAALQADVEGRPVIFTVMNIEDGKAVLDGNHPLAGKPLTFQLELVKVD